MEPEPERTATEVMGGMPALITAYYARERIERNKHIRQLLDPKKHYELLTFLFTISPLIKKSMRDMLCYGTSQYTTDDQIKNGRWVVRYYSRLKGIRL